MPPVSDRKIAAFRKKVWEYYRRPGRDFPWRHTREPYAILVSEVMLQQTQVDRVREKYIQFLRLFPNVSALASAKLSDIIRAWSGLGYNRRALYLKRAAIAVMEKFGGTVPRDAAALRSLPGVGDYTAAAVACFASGSPEFFIETNIRSAFIHDFFAGKEKVSDAEILPLVRRALDPKNPREWYFALMDYGAHLKRTVPNPSRRSRHHARQSKFEGSDRQIRGRVLKRLLAVGRLGGHDMQKFFDVEKKRLEIILAGLLREGIIAKEGRHYRISG